MTGRCRWRIVLVAGLVVACAAAPSEAAPPRVARVTLLVSPGATALVRQCMTLIREELVSSGFDVALVDPGPRVDPISIATVMRRQEGALASVALLGEPGRPGAELWILDRQDASPEIRRIPAPADQRERLPEILAIRTVEVLRASAIKLMVEATRPPPPAPSSPTPAPAAVSDSPPAPSPPPAAPPPAPKERPPVPALTTAAGRAAPAAEPTAAVLGIEAGLSVLENAGAVGPAALPLARLRIPLGEWLGGRLTMAGLGSRPRLEIRDAGSTSIAQVLGLAELAVAFRPGSRLRPTLSAGGGILYLESQGVGIWPYQGLKQTRLTAAASAGAGILVRARRQVSFAFEIHGVLATPHPTLRFDRSEVATVAFPALLASLTMVVWL